MQKTITSLQFLPPVKVVNGQTRGFNQAGVLTFQTTFNDRTKGVLTYDSARHLIAAVGQNAPDANGTAKFLTVGAPAINDVGGSNGGRVAFAATLAIGEGGVTASNNAAIVAQDSTGQKFYVRKGEADTDTGAPFASFGDPVFALGDRIAFAGKLTVGGAVTPANAPGLWSGVAGNIRLIARQGAFAPDASGAPTTATFSKFSGLALPETLGAVFLGKLKRSTTVTARNDTGIWAADDARNLSLVVRTGDSLTAGAAPKQVSQVQFLPSVRGVPGQTRGFNEDGFLIFRVIFTDRTEGIFKVLR